MLKGPYYIPHDGWGYPWCASLVQAEKYEELEEAEAAALVFAATHPNYIGELELVPVAMRITSNADFYERVKNGAKKREVVFAYVVEVVGGPKQTLYLIQRKSQGQLPCRWDTTKSLTHCEKFKGAGYAESAALMFTAGYPKYLQKVRVVEVLFRAIKFEWTTKGRSR